MRIRIDRDLPVPIPVQIQGQIEYGVSNGDFPPGSRLPSVRELAEALGVSPVTISSVYRELAERNLIETTRGRGTFVRDPGAEEDVACGQDTWLDMDIARLLDRADRRGVDRSDLVARVQRAASVEPETGRPLHIAFVGVYLDATHTYAAALRPYLRARDTLAVTTFADLASRPEANSAIDRAELVLTFAHREHELAPYLGGDVVVRTVHLIPSSRTRTALAELDPRSRVVLVSSIPEFLPTFRSSFERLASHVADVVPLSSADPAFRSVLELADVVIYGTGSEQLAREVPPHVRVFEYRHEPDPIHIERSLLPVLAQLRRHRDGAPSPTRTGRAADAEEPRAKSGSPRR